MAGIVAAVSRSKHHSFSKRNQQIIHLIARLGVEGSAHMGEKVKHRFHIKTKGRLGSFRDLRARDQFRLVRHSKRKSEANLRTSATD
jgi:hypothetical protein